MVQEFDFGAPHGALEIVARLQSHGGLFVTRHGVEPLKRAPHLSLVTGLSEPRRRFVKTAVAEEDAAEPGNHQCQEYDELSCRVGGRVDGVALGSLFGARHFRPRR